MTNKDYKALKSTCQDLLLINKENIIHIKQNNKINHIFSKDKRVVRRPQIDTSRDTPLEY